MARPDRLFRLLDTLRRLPQPVTAARLAEETEVSERTLYRDIDTLRAGGALIDGAPGFGYSLVEDPALPPQMFTRLEVEALVLGLGEVRQSGDPALQKAADGALAKITATLPERVQRQAIHTVHMSYRYEKRDPPSPVMALLREACWDEQVVHIRYLDKDGKETERDIWPLGIVFLDRSLMLLAHCRLRMDFRRFHINRITAAERRTESFRPRRVAMLREFIRVLRQGPR
ncbi:MAG: transcriptional regulator [Cereibacter sphaeroides]|uniref:Transcriptional regulator n=1 Tax=Cereibacter sphaeroides TaxID=1063 RepID=A0A2W5S1E9_CERSP|nr:MAG: transcriptional regulator [Cereibacter sphaeroides]